MDIIAKGPGEVMVCFVDQRGKALVQERLRISGSDNVAARRPVNLFVDTSNGRIPVSPVLTSHGRKQRVTFDGRAPADFTAARCREIGCGETVIQEAARGKVDLLPADPSQMPTHGLPAKG